MGSAALTAALRDALAERLRAAIDEAEPLIEEHVAAHSEQGRQRGRVEAAESLNQAARRIRQAKDFSDLASTIVDAVCQYAQGAAVFRISGDRAKGERIGNVNAGQTARFLTLDIGLAEARALAGAVETRDPVVAMSAPPEVPAEMLEIAGHDPGGRVAIFPIARGERVEALLYCWGAVQSAPIELLAQVAGLSLPAPPPAPLVTINAAPAAKTDRPDWDALPPDQQEAHLRAQRFARVQVAEMRLTQAEVVYAGRAHRDLYGVLQDKIDAARGKYRRTFIEPYPGMVDYLHLEIVRTLANDNPRLLGESYPGPLA